MLKFSFLSTVPIRLFLSLSALLQVTVLPAQSPAKPKLDLNITVSAKADQTMYDAAECIDGCLIAVGQTQSTQNSGQDAWLVKNAGVSRDLPEIFPEKRRYVAIGPLTGYIFFLKG